MLPLARRSSGIKLQAYASSRSLQQLLHSNKPPSSPAKLHAEPQRLKYYIPRNTRGNLPVYTDVRNAGGRHLVLVRNVEGDVGTLAKDLSTSLFETDSDEASRMKIQIAHSKHLVISGGRWKNEVLEWLKKKGF